jgi:hypothetical protein
MNTHPKRQSRPWLGHVVVWLSAALVVVAAAAPTFIEAESLSQEKIPTTLHVSAR